MQQDQTIQTLRTMAQDGKQAAELLHYLVLELKVEQQLELMVLFSKAFDVTLGEVTAITGWWHDDSAEMNDNDINAYISPIINDYLKTNPAN